MRWLLKWEMDSIQWEINWIDIIHQDALYNIGKTYCEYDDWTECITFAYFNLIPYLNNENRIRLLCPENTYTLTKADIEFILKTNSPEHMI